MHDDVLTDGQRQLLPLIRKFSSQFGLVGGTAVALQLGHRRSIDFDLFSLAPFELDEVGEVIRGIAMIEQTLISGKNELSVVVNKVKLTFYRYPFKIGFRENFDGIKMADIKTLAAMKALALGKRAKWKDYVDLYFIFKGYSLNDVVDKAEELFGGEFNEKLFRVQLAYFEDIDYSEAVEFMPGFRVEDEVVKEELRGIGLQK